MAGEAWIPARLYRGANRWWDDAPTTDPDAPPATGTHATVWRTETRRPTISVTVWRGGVGRPAIILGVWDGFTIRPLV